MGVIIAKFMKKKSPYEILEKLENEITEIEEFSKTTENTKKKIVGRFIILAFSTYLILALGLYFYYHRISPYQKLMYTSPLIAVPIVTYVIKTFLTWYYSRKIRKNHTKLAKLKEEKKKLLEKVEETETYKVAKQILEKFGEPSKKPAITIKDSTSVISSKAIVSSSSIVNPTVQELRQRTVGPPAFKSRLSFPVQETNLPTPTLGTMSRIATPANTSVFARRAITDYSTPNVRQNIPSTSSALQLPRAILPQKRTVLDKMFDYLVGDGPSNRYALICKNCFNHNGMAFKEEFEYLSFKCCYCSFFNPSRKKRPSGPKFEPRLSQSRTLTADSSESDVPSDESDDSKPIITELRSDSPETIEANLNVDQNSASVDTDTTGSVLSKESIAPTDALKDSIVSPVEIQEGGDSQAAQEFDVKNPFEEDPFESRHSSGDGRNPFDDDSAEEQSNSRMDFETFQSSETVQDIDQAGTQEIKKD